MNKKKLCIQVVICVVALGAVYYGNNSNIPQVAKIFDQVKAVIMEQPTMEDVKDVGTRITAVLAGVPSKVVSAVSKVNSQSRYGEPIDQKASDGVKQVHAAAGGVVEASGKDDELGLYVKIRHEDAVTVYGHLSDIGVVEKERVQRGEIIGSYDISSGDEFYYDLQENL
ncbi:peptidoglycan DD-metalloendopeptidase family protein [Ihubacter sp. rT4E-8]|uniref:peptidoglycan DD-metalloendopeptidase family protein n=1 Tax=unclassified Ihubacter TaxID=2633299 RepID=UPI003C7DA551